MGHKQMESFAEVLNRKLGGLLPNFEQGSPLGLNMLSCQSKWLYYGTCMRNANILIHVLAVLFINLAWLAACSPAVGNDTPAAPTAPSRPSPTPAATQKTPEATPPLSQTVGAPGTEGIPLDQDRGIPPLQPAGVEAMLRDGSVELTWQGTGSDILVHYVVYRRPLSVEEWEAVDVVPVKDDNQGEYAWTDTLPEIKEPLLYALTAVDQYGNESQLSEPVRVDPNP